MFARCAKLAYFADLHEPVQHAEGALARIAPGWTRHFTNAHEVETMAGDGGGDGDIIKLKESLRVRTALGSYTDALMRAYSDIAFIRPCSIPKIGDRNCKGPDYQILR